MVASATYGYAALHADFVYLDDHILVRFFDYHSDPRNLFDALLGPASTRHFFRTESYFRPVMAVSQIVDSTLSRWLFGGPSAGWYRFTNFLLHLLNVFLCRETLLRLLRLSQESAPETDTMTAQQGTWIANVLSAVYAVHPALVFSVAWIMGRNEMWLSALSFLCLLSVLNWTETGRSIDLSKALGAFVLAFFTKESAVGLLAVVSVLVHQRGRFRLRSAAKAKHWYFGAVFAFLVAFSFRAWMLGGDGANTNALAALLQSGLQAWRGILVFLGKAGIPAYLSNLPTRLDAPVWPGILVLAAAVGLSVWIFRAKAPGIRVLLAIAWIWFLGFLVPSLLHPTPQWADTFVLREDKLYTAIFGLVLLVALGLSRLKQPRPGVWYVLLAVASAATFFRARDLASSVDFYENAVRNSPRLPMAHLHLGDAYMMSHDLEAAESEYLQTLGMSPGEPKAHNNYGTLLEKKGDLTGALREFEVEIRVNPDFDLGWTNFARVAELLGKPEVATDALETVVRRNPGMVEAQVGLYSLYRKLGRSADAEKLAAELDSRGIRIVAKPGS